MIKDQTASDANDSRAGCTNRRPTTRCRPTPNHPARIHKHRRGIPDISAQVHIPRSEAQGVFAEELSDYGVVPAVAVLVQAGVGVPLPAGVGEAWLPGAVGLALDLAERVVGDVVDNTRCAGAGGVLHKVADRTEIVGQAPGDDARAGLVRENLVDMRSDEIAICQRAGRSALEGEVQVVSIVHKPLGRVICAVPVDVDFLADATVVDVVGAGDLLRKRAGRCVRVYRSPPIVLVPGVEFVLAGRGEKRRLDPLFVSVPAAATRSTPSFSWN